ncbi:hypothetical protein BDY21DRAFT_419098 [Lineolata rhizophorae]|uniref:Uncharacterized protein n=1 Tax=Lineolata rhizophorae TaxID=578093 RepID=A0A6A6P8N2_9PEZI|nr:hypothetical protein BDY21DRAFT_419098 [Lineolata rhizophorae]
MKDFVRPPVITNDKIKGYTRAILLRPDEEEPEFVWLPYEEPYPGLQRPKVTDVLGEEADRKAIGPTIGDPVLRRLMHHGLWIIGNGMRMSGFLATKGNKALRNIVGLEATAWLPVFHGSVLIFGSKQLSGEPKTLDDLDTGDLRPAVNYLSWYQNAAKPLRLARELTYPVQGVRIVGNGITWEEALESNMIVEVTVSPMENMFWRTPPTTVSLRLGLPILMTKSPKYQWTTKPENPGFNRHVPALQVCCDPSYAFRTSKGTLTGFGRMSEWWLHDAKEVILAREDRKPLHVYHVMALIDFFGTLLPFFRQYSAAPDDRKQGCMEDILAKISKESFLAFFNDWKKANRFSSEIPSMYEI